MATSKAKQDHAARDGEERVSTTPSDIFKVGIRIPPFWPEEPEIWFSQIEGQFQIAGITSDLTKFHYVIGQLDRQFSCEVKDIIMYPPAGDKYEKLKTELIKRLSASNEKKVQQLLMHEELGDRKPSQFLRHLQSLAGQQIKDDFLRTIWISRLPTNIQTVLAAQPSANLEILADLADRIRDIAPPTQQVASTSNSQVLTLDAMVKEIAELRQQVTTLTMQNNRRPRSHSRHRDQSSNRSQSSHRRYPICWYHSKHGNKAQKCIKPCDFGKSGNAKGTQ